MVLFVVALKSERVPEMPQHARDALEAARRFSGAHCVGITNFAAEAGWEPAGAYMQQIREVEGMRPSRKGMPIDRSSVYRWLIMDEYIRAHEIKEPVFNCDWDLLVFEPLEPHFRSLGADTADCGVCIDKVVNPGSTTAPYLVNNLGSIAFFSDMLMLLYHHWPNIMVHGDGSGDMSWWAKMPNLTGYTFSDLAVEKDGAYFDLNLTLDGERYEMEPNGYKRIEWRNKKPYFAPRDRTEWVRAVALHCFMGYKNRTSELLAQAL